MKTHKDKIVVIGAGNVGEAIAYTWMVRTQANDIVLVDVKCADARLIIIAAGVARKPGQTRLELAQTKVSVVQSITENIMKYAKNPFILVVSNPADITTL